jgi:hypothetical protein
VPDDLLKVSPPAATSGNPAITPSVPLTNPAAPRPFALHNRGEIAAGGHLARILFPPLT